MTVPGLFAILASDIRSLLTVAVLGLVWGYGAILYGRGLDVMGVSLGVPIMLGLTNAIGTLVPIAIRDVSFFASGRGLGVILGVGIIIAGILFYSKAGSRRTDETGGSTGMKPRNFRKGMIICVLAGVFSPMLNFAFVYGEPFKQLALENGVSMVNASNPVWCVGLTAGFIPNLIACAGKFRSNGTWKEYGRKRSGIFFAALAGLLWYASMLLYGIGSTGIGSSGASTGWAAMQSVATIAGAVSGIIAGEWNGSSRRSFMTMLAGLLLLVAGVIIIASNNI